MKARGALRHSILAAIARNGTAGASIWWLATTTGSDARTVTVILHRLRTNGLVITTDGRHFIAGCGIVVDPPDAHNDNREAA